MNPLRFPLTLCAAFLTAGAGAATPTCPPGAHPEGGEPPAAYEWKCVGADGRVDGPWLNWYDNGQLLSERHMKKGREHGRQRSWWPNGQLMMEGVSVDGHRYQGYKYWTVTGEPTEIKVETETVVQPATLPAARPGTKTVQ